MIGVSQGFYCYVNVNVISLLSCQKLLSMITSKLFPFLLLTNRYNYYYNYYLLFELLLLFILQVYIYYLPCWPFNHYLFLFSLFLNISETSFIRVCCVCMYKNKSPTVRLSKMLFHYTSSKPRYDFFKSVKLRALSLPFFGLRLFMTGQSILENL